MNVDLTNGIDPDEPFYPQVREYIRSRMPNADKNTMETVSLAYFKGFLHGVYSSALDEAEERDLISRN